MKNNKIIGNKTSLFFVYIVLVLGIICIGLSAILTKLTGLPGTVSAFYRFIVAGVFIIPWNIAKKIKFKNYKIVLVGLLSGFFFGLDLALWNTGLMLTNATNATLLANNAPLWVGLGSIVLFKEKLNNKYWMGLFLAIAGISFIVGFIHKGKQSFRGEIFALLAGFFYALYLLTAQQGRINTDTATFTTLSIIGGIVTLAIINMSSGVSLTGFSAKTWLTLIALGLISHLLGWLCINYALGRIPASKVSVTLLGQVVITALLSIPILGETIKIHQIIGGVFVISGIYIVNRRNSEHKANLDIIKR